MRCSLHNRPDAPLGGDVAGAFELIRDEAVAELGVVAVHVMDGVHQVGIVVVAHRARLALPLVEGLVGEAEHPAGQPHREPLSGQLLDQREHHFGSASLAK